MNEEKTIITDEMQYYLRVLAVAVAILVNAKWYRSRYPGKRNIYLVLIPILILGLYFDYLYTYENLFIVLVLLICLLVYLGII